MRAVMAPVPESLLEERRRAGVDGRDEMWEGELHMVPPPRGAHQRLSTDVLLVFGPLSRAKDLVPHMETGLFRRTDDYRVPDQCYCRPDQVSDRGVEGAVLAVEFLSPGDETYAKLEWYATMAVDEVLVVEPDTRVAELFVRRGEKMVLVDPAGGVRLASLGVELSTVDGPRLRIVWDGGAAEV